MGQAFCCHSSRSNNQKLKHAEFRSESTFDDSDIYNGSDNIPPAKTERIRVVPRNTDPETPRHGPVRVSSRVGVCAFMGLAPIVEETSSSVSKSSHSPRIEPITTTRFLSNGSMKNYQRFVRPH
jgi:hypothetical protein